MRDAASDADAAKARPEIPCATARQHGGGPGTFAVTGRSNQPGVALPAALQGGSGIGRSSEPA